MSDNHRIAIINPDKCKPKKCAKECKTICPVNKIGKLCIEIEDIAIIHESLCIGCGQCTSSKGCPFDAIKIVNLPTQLVHHLVHSYGANLFKLYKLPAPKINKIIGIIGQNGTGKSTIMNILSGLILPNYDTKNKDDVKVNQAQVLRNVKGTELQKYLKLVYDKKLQISVKPQNILQKIKDQNITVKDIMLKFAESSIYEKVITYLNLNTLFSNKLSTLSGGELQRIICAVALMRNANVFMFDEPTNYLDIEYRIKIANLIKDISNDTNYVFVVDHDLSIMDFVADYVHIMYGEPGSYGAISNLYNTSEGINIYFDGYLPSENIRFRSEPYKLKEIGGELIENIKNQFQVINYEEKVISFDNFILTIKGEKVMNDTNMIIILGKNGTGKTTYAKYLAEEFEGIISYKNQIGDFASKNQKMLVEELLYNEIKDAMTSSMFMSDVINLLGIDKILSKKIGKLSGGEAQRVSITLCLGKKADIYLLDEPSASLDVEYRFNVTKVIKRFMLHNKKIGFIIEHDILMAITLAKELHSKILVMSEVKKENNIRYCEVSNLLGFNDGITKFLKSINTTFRTDKINNRPKINKLDSVNDRDQKNNDIYFFIA